MRYRLRTLLTLLIVGPPLLAGWLMIDRDPFQLFLAIGFLTYGLGCIAVGWVLGCSVDRLRRLL